MTAENQEKKPGPFAAMRQHYRDSKQDHRPVPVVLPLLVLTGVALWTYSLLDPVAAAMTQSWPGWLVVSARAITDLGKSDWILYWSVAIILAGMAVYRLTWITVRRRLAAQAIQMATYVFLTVAISGLISNLVKRAIGRPRPEMFSEHGLFSLNPFARNSAFESFPSGHATTDGALWAALALLYPPLRWPFLAIGFVLALTRVFVAAHYPTDALVGFCWGMWFSFMLAIVFARHGMLFSHRDGRLKRLT